MVVLALAIGVAEQDDFANIPDLQETAQAAPPANPEAPPEKRYRVMHECLLRVCDGMECGMTLRGGNDLVGGFRMAVVEGSAAVLELRHSPAASPIKSQLNVA